MNYYLAPMEGLTGYVYRNAYHACFHPMDKYITPFIAPKTGGAISSRERNDILPEHNQGLTLVPQLLTNSASNLLDCAVRLKEYGYQEINLNLGCPSGTVVSKHKGAGFLARREELDSFLELACKGLEGMGMTLSVKTRLGMDSPEEFPGLVELFNRYPLKELIIHPRIQKDFYKNIPNMEAFAYGLKACAAPVCYNGDIFTAGDLERLRRDYPNLDTVMLGRGIISNPGLLDLIVYKKPLELERIKEFHQRIYHGYREIMSGERNVLFKMKELWASMIQIFSDNGKYLKRIKKARGLKEYETAVCAVFQDLNLIHGAG